MLRSQTRPISNLFFPKKPISSHSKENLRPALLSRHVPALRVSQFASCYQLKNALRLVTYTRPVLPARQQSHIRSY
jgi:hypothetical protein